MDTGIQRDAQTTEEGIEKLFPRKTVPGKIYYQRRHRKISLIKIDLVKIPTLENLHKKFVTKNLSLSCEKIVQINSPQN